jgi:hypothetical protein
MGLEPIIQGLGLCVWYLGRRPNASRLILNFLG